MIDNGNSILPVNHLSQMVPASSNAFLGEENFGDQLCWAACFSMAANYLNLCPDNRNMMIDYAAYVWGDIDWNVPLNLSQPRFKKLDIFLHSTYETQTYRKAGTRTPIGLSFDEAKNAIANGMPVMLGLKRLEGGHAVLAVGINKSGDILYLDPMDKEKKYHPFTEKNYNDTVLEAAVFRIKNQN